MSSESGPIGPGDFADMTPAEQEQFLEEQNEQTTDSGGFFSADIDVMELADKMPDGAITARGEGMTIEDITDEYDLGRGPSFIVRGFTRWFGVDDVPPVVEVLIGLYLSLRP